MDPKEVPPYDDEAECVILGAILRDNAYLAEVQALGLVAEEFCHSNHQTIFRGMLSLAEKGTSIEEIILGGELRSSGKLDGCGGLAYLGHLTEGIPDLVEISHYVNVVKEKARLRRLMEISNEIVTRIHQGAQADELVSETIVRLVDLETSRSDRPEPFSVDRLIQQSKELPAGKSSGWECLDKIGVCFHAKELAVLAGRTGHGKTTSLVSLLVNWLKAAKTEGKDELLIFYSAEEPEVRIFHRLLSLLTADTESLGSWWDVNEIRNHFQTSPDEIRPKALEKAKAILRSWESSLLIVHRPVWTISNLESHARNQANRQKVGGIITDYIQRIPGPVGTRYDRRDLEVTAVCRRLRGLAVDLSIPVVAGAQVNRESIPPGTAKKITEASSFETAEEVIRTTRPDLSHLREGGIEQEADNILALLNYAADYRTDSSERLPAITPFEFGTIKNRYGEVGRWVTLDFVGRYGLLRDRKDPYWDSGLVKQELSPGSFIGHDLD